MSVIIPVRDDVTNLRACLVALANCDPPADETIIVDDASTHERTAVAAVARDAGARMMQLDENVGPAGARNRGAATAEGEVLFFIDADCEAAPNAIARVKEGLRHDQPYDALFGSYDDAPVDRHVVSAWKNLAHHHTHQQAAGEASTFWTGCGAVRRDVFDRLGGLDASRYDRPCIEDVEFGLRLREAGGRIRLDPTLQVKHRKRWTLLKLLRTDLFDRAIPWTQLLREHPRAARELNLRSTQKVAAILAGLSVGLLVVAAVRDPWSIGIALAWLAAIALTEWDERLTTPAAALALGSTAALFWILQTVRVELACSAACIAGVVAANFGLYRLVATKLGLAPAVLSIVPHIGHYLVALAGFAIGKLSRNPFG